MWRQLIGVFGWLDIAMPRWTYPVLSVLLLASFIDRSGYSRPVRARIALVSLVAAITYCVGVFVLFFITETPAGADRIYGLQGRYFIVALPVLAVTVSALLDRSLGRGRAPVAITSSLISLTVMTEAL